MKFSFFSYLSLFYEILFLFICIIVLWYSLDINECPLSIAIKVKSIEIVQFLVDHGTDVNMKLILFLFILIIVLERSLSFYIYHCFMKFSFFSYLSLFYEILFLFIFIIVLWNSLYIHIYHCFIQFFFFSYWSLFYTILLILMNALLVLQSKPILWKSSNS